LLNFAIQTAHEAGRILAERMGRAIQITNKGIIDLVTEADLAAESLIIERIKSYYPRHGVLAEESGASDLEGRPKSEYQWIIDPLDGTYSFVHGVPLYGVLIGLEVLDEPAVGVVNLPALGEMVYAARGQGCFWNGARAGVSSTKRLEDALLLSTDFGTCEQHGFGRAAAALESRASARRTWGDCYGHVLVATGRADVMLDPTMNVWDCAPLLPILEEAGGTFTDWRGERTIRGGNAISTNGALFDQVLKTVTSDE